MTAGRAGRDKTVRHHVAATRPRPDGAQAQELAALRARAEEAEELLGAIKRGEVDAIVRHGPGGEQIFTLEGADRPYRVMVETMAEGALTLDPGGTITYCNAQFASLLGAPLEQVIGRKLEELVAPAERGRLDGMVRRARAAAIRDELRLLRPDGGIVHAMLAMCELAETNGAVIAVITDLTELKRSMAAREQLARMVDVSRDAMFMRDMDGLVTTWNPGAEALFGYTAEEVIGRPLTFLLPPGTEDEYARGLQDVRAGKPIVAYEAQRRRRDGGLLDVSITISPVLGSEGRPTSAATVMHDITERKRAQETVFALNRDLERRVKERTRALTEAQAYLRAITDNTPDHIIVQDKDLRYLTVINPQLGLTAEEQVGKTDRELLPGEEGEQLTAIKTEVMRSGKPVHLDLPLKDKQGHIRIFDGSYVPRLGPSGEVIGLLGYFRNVTEQRAAEKRIQTLNSQLLSHVAELETLNRELETFSYSVSHDLRGPLRAIDGFSKILLEEHAAQLDDEGKRLLQVVGDGAVKMGRLIDDILSFARAGRIEMNPAPIDMKALVDTVIAEPLAPALAERKLVFDVTALPPARGDRAMLERVWTNLIDNAVKFTRPKPEARIEIGAKSAEGETVYFIRDNGVGFDMKYADKLFGVFQRLHGAEFSGTGIGLALVKRIIGRHGGRVWAEGKPGEGATFYFSLPDKRSGAA